MSLHRLAPAGTPIGLADLADGLLGQHGGTPSLELFRSDICQRYGVRHCFFVSTGRAAFAIALRALRELGPQDRDEVLIPSYTCYSVPASVARAGLKIRVCDVDSATLDYDPQTLDRVDFSRVLCVASANLYGIPNDLGRLRTIADRHGAFLLDDAAQSMEAKVGGEYSGTLGDVGFFSLDKGKNITTIDGGILVTNKDDIAARIGAIVAQLSRPSVSARARYSKREAVVTDLLDYVRTYRNHNGKRSDLGLVLQRYSCAIGHAISTNKQWHRGCTSVWDKWPREAVAFLKSSAKLIFNCCNLTTARPFR